MKDKLRLVYWLFPIIFCFAVYWLGVRAWFCQDDFAWLGLRLQVHDFPSFFEAMFKPEAQGTIRPWSERGFFMLFSYLFGMHALPFRLFVFANQCLNIILLMLIARQLTGSKLAAFLSPIFWLANVALVTPMVWTSAYNEVLCTTFLLLSFYLFLRYVQTERKSFYFGQLASFILGFGALEINFVYPLIVGLYSLLFARRYLRSTLPMFAISAVYVIVDRLAVAHSAPQGAYFYDLNFSVVSLLSTLAQYWTTVLGVNEHTYGKILQYPQWFFTVAVGVTTTAVTAFVLWQTKRRNMLPLFLALWFLIVLGPLLPLHNHVTDYYLTIPAIGLAILAAYSVSIAPGPLYRSVVAAMFIGLYLLPSLQVVQAGVRYRCELSDGARSLVQSVAYAKCLHPDKSILLNHVTDQLFWTAVYDHPFLVLGWHDVFILPESLQQIHQIPYMQSVNHYSLPEAAIKALLNRDAAVVYDIEGRRLRNVTESYSLRAQSHQAQILDSYLDLAVPYFADQLGNGWYGEESGYRWASQHAVVYLPGPSSAEQKLRIHGFVNAEVMKPGPLHISLSIDGRAQPVQTITPTEQDFTFSYSIPAEFIGRPKMKVAFDVDRPTVPAGENRVLGVAFGTFAIQ